MLASVVHPRWICGRAAARLRYTQPLSRRRRADAVADDLSLCPGAAPPEADPDAHGCRSHTLTSLHVASQEGPKCTALPPGSGAHEQGHCAGGTRAAGISCISARHSSSWCAEVAMYDGPGKGPRPQRRGFDRHRCLCRQARCGGEACERFAQWLQVVSDGQQARLSALSSKQLTKLRRISCALVSAPSSSDKTPA